MLEYLSGIQKVLVFNPSTADMLAHSYTLSTHEVEAGEVHIQETLFKKKKKKPWGGRDGAALNKITMAMGF